MKKIKLLLITFMIITLLLGNVCIYSQDDFDLDLDDDFEDDISIGESDSLDMDGDDFGIDDGLDGDENPGEIDSDSLGYNIAKSEYNKKHGTKSSKGDKDPFFPLVTKPKRKPRKKRVKRRTSTRTSQRTQQIVIPDIELKVICIVGNETKRMALIEFEGKTDEYFRGDSKAGGFKIIDINSKSVTVYSLRKRRQRTFKLPE